MEYKYNYTIIIPHRNLPELLKRCIASIPKRDDLQIIIVDDDSDSDCIDSFTFTNENNIEILYDKSGKRQGHARNIGIDHADGKWLIFADSDDFFLYSINKALDENINNPADIVYFKATVLDSATYLTYPETVCLPNVSINKFLEGDKFGEHYVRYRYPAPWGKFIKTELVRKHDIRFAEIERLEDMQFSYQCGYYANKVDIYNYAIYCYVKRENNVTKQITLQSKYTLIKVFTDCLIFFKNKDIQDSPSYKIVANELFDNLELMRLEKNKYYLPALKYMYSNGITRREIRENLRRMACIHIKSRIYKYIHI